jgi:hypothetical protein
MPACPIDPNIIARPRYVRDIRALSEYGDVSQLCESLDGLASGWFGIVAVHSTSSSHSLQANISEMSPTIALKQIAYRQVS